MPFLKDVLIMWKKEVEKKGSKMSYEDAYYTLGLNKDDAPLVVNFFYIFLNRNVNKTHYPDYCLK